MYESPPIYCTFPINSATWYSTLTYSTLLRFNCKNGVSIQNFYFLWGQYMCGAPERLTGHGVRCAHFHSVITTIMDHKVQLLKPFNLCELYTAYQNLHFSLCTSLIQFPALRMPRRGFICKGSGHSHASTRRWNTITAPHIIYIRILLVFYKLRFTGFLWYTSSVFFWSAVHNTLFLRFIYLAPTNLFWTLQRSFCSFKRAQCVDIWRAFIVI
jgi:hypothetical protein